MDFILISILAILLPPALTQPLPNPHFTTTTAFPASLCAAPCIITWSPLTTTLTLQPPAGTISFEDAPSSITVSFDVITTVTTVHLAPSTSPNTDPTGTPTLSYSLSVSLSSIAVATQSDIINNNGQQVFFTVEEEVNLVEDDTAMDTSQDFGDIDYDDEFEGSSDGNEFIDRCEFFYADKPAQPPDTPYDMLACDQFQQEILAAAFENTLDVLEIINQMTANSLGFTQFFPDPGYFDTLRNYMNIIHKLYDPNIPISADPQKPNVRIVCVNANNPLPVSVDASGNVLQRLLSKCAEDPLRGLLLADTVNFDTDDKRSFSNPEEAPDRCVPVIHLCPAFFDGLHFLDDVDAQFWCNNEDVSTGYNFVQDADIDYATSPADAIAVNDMAYQEHFATFALTLIHEATHVDQIGVLAGKTGGTAGQELYLRSQCREFQLFNEPDEAEANAENHAVAVHEQFFRNLCGMPLM